MGRTARMPSLEYENEKYFHVSERTRSKDMIIFFACKSQEYARWHRAQSHLHMLCCYAAVCSRCVESTSTTVTGTPSGHATRLHVQWLLRLLQRSLLCGFGCRQLSEYDFSRHLLRFSTRFMLQRQQFVLLEAVFVGPPVSYNH